MHLWNNAPLQEPGYREYGEISVINLTEKKYVTGGIIAFNTFLELNITNGEIVKANKKHIITGEISYDFLHETDYAGYYVKATGTFVMEPLD